MDKCVRKFSEVLVPGTTSVLIILDLYQTTSIELLQVMSLFIARSALELLLFPWFFIWSGEEWSMIVRWIRSSPVYHSQLDRMKCWKARNRQTETCGGRIDRLKLRANEIDRLKFLDANFFRFGDDSQLDRLKCWKACNRQSETCGRRIDRLKLRAIKIDRLKLFARTSSASAMIPS